MKRSVSIAAIMFSLILQGVLPGYSMAVASEKIPVYVSIPPQAFFVKAIGGKQVDVFVMVSPAKSPAEYEPSPTQMRSLAGAEIYFAVGVPFEDTWLDRFAAINPKMRIIHTEDGIEKKPINRHTIYYPSSSLGDHHRGHNHEIKDPHVWLSPPLVLIQARHILVALKDAAPDQKTEFESNYKRFINQVLGLDAGFRALFAGDAGKRFLVFHPSWGYFADAYGLEQIPIESEGKAPKAHEVKNLIRYADKYGLKDILAQPQFSTRYAGIIANEIRGRLVYADPLAEDWIKNLESTALSIKQALR